MDNNRGINFLVGLVTLFLLWRAYQSGLFDSLAFLVSSGGEGYRSSAIGTVLFSFVIELVATIGAMTILVLTGLWDVTLKASRWAAEGLQEGREYLKKANEALPSRPNPESDPLPPDEPEPEPLEPADPLLVLAESIKANEELAMAAAEATQGLREEIKELKWMLESKSNAN